MIIALTHPDHGTHIAQTEAEAQSAEANGWKRDPELSKTLATGRKPEEEKRGPGRPRKEDA